MTTVGIRELKQRASELIRLVREQRSPIQITYHGQVVALIVPAESPSPEMSGRAWAELDVLAAEIGARWPSGVSAVEAVSNDRR